MVRCMRKITSHTRYRENWFAQVSLWEKTHSRGRIETREGLQNETKWLTSTPNSATIATLGYVSLRISRGIECTGIDIVAGTRLTVRSCDMSENAWPAELLVHERFIRFQKWMSVPASCWQVASLWEYVEHALLKHDEEPHVLEPLGRSGGSRIHELRQVRRLRSEGSFDKKHTDAQVEA